VKIPISHTTPEMDAASETSISPTRDYPFLGFPSIAETHRRFPFAGLVGSYNRRTAFPFPRFVCKPFLSDVELMAMRIS
jgi:hypothetical protein